MAGDRAYTKINFYKDEVLAAVEKAKTDSLKNIGLAIEGHAKVNIVNNDQIDTGFMVNSGYFKMRSFSTYGGTPASTGGRARDTEGKYVKGPAVGKYEGTKSAGGERKRAPQATLPSGKDALVGFAAIYAIYQEQKRSFLYRAAQQVVGQVGGLIRKV